MGIANSIGYNAPIELGYKKQQGHEVYGTKYNLSLVFDQSTFSAPFYNAKTPNQFGRKLLYATAQRPLLISRDTGHGLYWFAQPGWDLSGSKVSIQNSYAGGVIWEGPLKSRPYDHLAFAINNMHYDLNYVNKYLMPKRTAVGGTERPDSNLTILEFNYAMALTPWLRWTSWYQYIAQPNGLAFGAYPKQNLPGASVFGLKVMIMVDRFVGLSKARGPLVGNPGKTFSF